nr:MFS transporter [uncultured Sphingomonas sp.]
MTKPLTSPLQIRDFRLYWCARFFAVMATMGMVVIIGYQVYDTARSDYGMSIRDGALMLGVLGLVQFVPLALLTPVAGWAADRFERRTVARLANGVDLLIALCLALATWNDALNLPLLFSLGAMHGVARVFLGPSLAAIAPNIVPPDLLPKAIALSSIAWQSAAVAGPALGGFLYAAGASLPYWASVALLATAVLLLTPVRRIVPPAMQGHPHPFHQMVEGLTYVRRHRFLLGAITLDLFAVLFSGAIAMLPVFARDILHVGTEGLGLMRGAPAIGAALVAAWFSFNPLHNNVGIKMLWSVAAFGAMTILFGLSKSFGLSLGILALFGAADMMSVYVRSSLVQLHTPDMMRGRVSAVSGLAISASNELGELQAGVAAALLGPVAAVVAGGAAAIGIAGLWSYLFPELRRAKTFDPPPEVLAQAVEQEKPA